MPGKLSYDQMKQMQFNKTGSVAPIKLYKLKSRKPKNKAIKQIVNKTLNSKLETKYVVAGGLNNVTFNGAISGPNEYYSIIPPIERGVGSWQMVGNAITPMEVRTDFHIGLTDVTRTESFVCVLFILESKRVKDYPLLTALGPSATFINATPNILKSGSSTQAQAWDGTPASLGLPVNNSEFTLLKKFVFKMDKNSGAQNGDVSQWVSPNVGGSSNYKHIVYKYKGYPKQLKYAPDGSSGAQYPNNDAPFWCIGYFKTDGTVADVAFQNINVTTVTSMTFKDA